MHGQQLFKENHYEAAVVVENMMVQLEVLEVEALENVTELDVGLEIDDIAVRDIS